MSSIAKPVVIKHVNMCVQRMHLLAIVFGTGCFIVCECVLWAIFFTGMQLVM